MQEGKSAMQSTGKPHPSGNLSMPSSVLALMRVARVHGVDIDRKSLLLPADGSAPTAAVLAQWARDAGLWGRAVRLQWRHLMRLQESGPVILLLRDGNAAVMVDCDVERRVV